MTYDDLHSQRAGFERSITVTAHNTIRFGPQTWQIVAHFMVLSHFPRNTLRRASAPAPCQATTCSLHGVTVALDVTR